MFADLHSQKLLEDGVPKSHIVNKKVLICIEMSPLPCYKRANLSNTDPRVWKIRV